VTNNSVQIRLDVTAIHNAVVRFGSADQAEYCAVIEVAGSQESLARLDDAKQEELLAAYCQFLNSVTFAFQLVVQVHPVDLSWYVSRVEERARALSPALVAIARDHAAYVQGLTRTRTLLERRIYIVVPWTSTADAPGTKRELRLTSSVPVRHGRGAIDRQFDAERIQRVLTDRCDVIGRQLGRAGLRATRLDDLGLAQLYHTNWAPEMARAQRLRRELADYSALVVGAEGGSGGRRRLSGHSEGHTRSIATRVRCIRRNGAHAFASTHPPRALIVKTGSALTDDQERTTDARPLRPTSVYSHSARGRWPI
jgi:hypothetical protein